ncbi:MAG: hypothetical protein Kow0073_04930 [Immundisolibacter sp.]
MKSSELTAPDIDRLVVDLAGQGDCRVRRDVFPAPAVCELEMRCLFERNRVIVGLDSQAPNPNDDFTAWIGRQPIRSICSS